MLVITPTAERDRNVLGSSKLKYDVRKVFIREVGLQISDKRLIQIIEVLHHLSQSFLNC